MAKVDGPLAAAALGIGAAAGTITSGTGFAVDPNASSGEWLQVGGELAFVLVGVAVITRGSPVTRGIAGGALGLLGIWVGLATYPVLVHGVVLWSFPPTAAGVQEPTDDEPPW